MFFWAICLLLAFSLGYRNFEQDILYLLAIVCYSKNYCDMKRDKLQIEFNWKSDIYKANVMAFARKHKIPIHEIN